MPGPDSRRLRWTISVSPAGLPSALPLFQASRLCCVRRFHNASATEIRNSIIATAQKSQIDDGSLDIDRGNGVPDAFGAFNLIASGRAARLPSAAVLAGRRGFTERGTQYRFDCFFGKCPSDHRQTEARAAIRCSVQCRAREPLPLWFRLITSISRCRCIQQNQFFGGDDLFVNIHSAKTSSIGANGDYAVGFYTEEFPIYCLTTGNSPSAIPIRESCASRLLGDFINAGKVSANVNIHSIHEVLPDVTAAGHDPR